MLTGTAASSSSRQRGVERFRRCGGSPGSRPGRWGALGRGPGPADRGAGRLDRGSGVERGADPLGRDAGLAEDARHGSAGLVQRGQEQMIAGELAAGFPGLLRGVLDQPLRVRRVRRLVATAPRAAPPAARLEAGAHLGRVQTESAQHRLGRCRRGGGSRAGCAPRRWTRGRGGGPPPAPGPAPARRWDSRVRGLMRGVGSGVRAAWLRR